MNMESMRIRSYAAPRWTNTCRRSPRGGTGRSRRTTGFGRRAATRAARWSSSGSAGARCIGGLAPKSTRPGRVRQRAWKPRDVKAVMDVRRKYPFMGKARIQAMLARKGRRLSVSTVGRIIERALAVGAIRPDRSGRPRRSATGFSPRARQAQAAAPLPEGAAFAALATRWKYGSKARRAGELVQRALARIDPHDLRPWRADAEGVREPKVRPPSVRSRSSW